MNQHAIAAWSFLAGSLWTAGFWAPRALRGDEHWAYVLLVYMLTPLALGAGALLVWAMVQAPKKPEARPAPKPCPHPASGTYCYICGVKRLEQACKRDVHSLWVNGTISTPTGCYVEGEPPAGLPGGYWHICGASSNESCDSGLHS